MRRGRILALASLMLLVQPACGDPGTSVKGNGEVVSETRSVASFDRLEATDGTDVALTVDATASGDVNLEVTGESNLLERVETTVEDGTLRASIRGRVEKSRGLEVAGTIAAVSEVSVNDGATAVITGVGDLVALSADNGGRIDGSELEVAHADVRADNGGQVTICATGPVTGSVRNGADLTVVCGGTVADVATANGGTATAGR